MNTSAASGFLEWRELGHFESEMITEVVVRDRAELLDRPSLGLDVTSEVEIHVFAVPGDPIEASEERTSTLQHPQLGILADEAASEESIEGKLALKLIDPQAGIRPRYGDALVLQCGPKRVGRRVGHFHGGHLLRIRRAGASVLL